MSPSATSAPPLPDIKDIADPDSLLSAGEIVALVGFLLALLGLLGVGGYFAWRALNRKPSTQRTPQQIARYRLEELEDEARNLSPNEFSLAVSETLKDYLAARFRDPVRFETSEEFLWRLSEARAQSLPPNLRDDVAGFLSISDEIKYGRPPDAEARKLPLLEKARVVVETDPPPPPEASPSKPGPRPKAKRPPKAPKRRQIVS